MRSFINGVLAGSLIGIIIALFYFTSDLNKQPSSKMGNIRILHKKAKCATKDLL